jgi:prolyl 4-hydroxylase
LSLDISDFGYSEVDDVRQPNRFATVLFYLNDGMVGGQTEFPRWVNGETNQGLKVTPEKGKAVLFYSHLPDGNMVRWYFATLASTSFPC